MSSELEKLIQENEAIEKRRRQADMLAAAVVSTPGATPQRFRLLFTSFSSQILVRNINVIVLHYILSNLFLRMNFHFTLNNRRNNKILLQMQVQTIEHSHHHIRPLILVLFFFCVFSYLLISLTSFLSRRTHFA